ncbi:MAG: SDR family NAD(P)-dependent oxidoreductase [Gammaproteobacteria bacterium]|nr:SDR family NAD(P)-dependent oxidoreductase [Gammaproteobacteria bacterium]
MYIITGASTGIGKALALALAAKGETVLIVGRHETTLQDVASASPQIHYHVADVSVPQAQQQLIATLSGKKIKGLVHNAGTISPLDRLEDASMDEWEQLIKLNLFAPLRLTQALLSNLQGGRVLNIGSGAAYFPMAGWSAYCVSKAALSMLTRCFQVEIKDPAVSSVMPGIVDTNMTSVIRSSTCMSDEQLAFHQQLYHDKRLIQPDTVAQFLMWLLIDVDTDLFKSKEWDIYDEADQASWLQSPHVVPKWG